MHSRFAHGTKEFNWRFASQEGFLRHLAISKIRFWHSIYILGCGTGPRTRHQNQFISLYVFSVNSVNTKRNKILKKNTGWITAHKVIFLRKYFTFKSFIMTFKILDLNTFGTGYQHPAMTISKWMSIIVGVEWFAEYRVYLDFIAIFVRMFRIMFERLQFK